MHHYFSKYRDVTLTSAHKPPSLHRPSPETISYVIHNIPTAPSIGLMHTFWPMHSSETCLVKVENCINIYFLK